MALRDSDEDRGAPAAPQPEPAHRDNHAQLSEMVATRLREQIVSGQIKQGQFLRIDAIAKSLDVSMTPVREGLLLLQSQAFVRLIPRRGFVVNSFNKQDLIDLFWAQAIFGGELASRAARNVSPELLEQLEHFNAEYEAAAAAGDHVRRDRAGHGFHRAINLAAESPRLALLLGSLSKQLPNRFYGEIEGRSRNAREYHPLILQAIQRRDGKAAGSLMHQHLVDGGEQLVAMLERQGVWGEPAEAEVPAPPSPSAKKSAAATGPGRRGGARKSAAG